MIDHVAGLAGPRARRLAPTAPRRPEESAGTRFLEGATSVPDTLSTGFGPPPTNFRDQVGPSFSTDFRTPAAATGEPGGSSAERATVVIEPGRVVFGKYEVLERLGRGGMGEVWLVRDVELDVRRAIKTITQGTAFNPEARARFRREARAMARFTHPNVVAVHDSRLDNQDVAYIVMEYVAGQSLEKVIKPGRPMPLDWVLRVLAQICDALQEAHGQGIIHRDLKPSNLILVDSASRRDVLKVLDFGIAKILHVEEVLYDARTMDGAFIGTPPYASPEQASGQAVPLSDIYSVGVILYEFLTGSRPFSGQAAVVVAKTLFTDPPTFADTNAEANVPPEVERVVMRCLAKKPEDRPQSAMELLAEFKAAMPTTEYVPGDKLAPTLVAPSGPGPSRRLVGIAATLIGIAAMAGALAVAIPRLSGPAKTPEVPADDREAAKAGPVPKPKAKPAREKQVVVDDRAFTLWHDRLYLPTGYDPADDAELADDGWPRDLVRKVDGVKFARIPGGEFAMGARDQPGEDRSDADDTNQPSHPVKLAGYYIQKYEVTNGELLAYTRKHGDRFTDPSASPTWRTWAEAASNAIGGEGAAKHPARQVSWRLAADFARKNGGRLPTEAQWEFAARSGELARVLVWDDATDRAKSYDSLANIFQGDPKNQLWTSEGGKYPLDRTRHGVMDMAGNVREWCRDPWVAYDKLATAGPIVPTEDPDPGSEMVARGGSFNLEPTAKFVTRRGKALRLSDEVPADVGFRIVLECPE